MHSVIFRKRKTDFPRTYFLLKRDEEYFLLFWLEYGKDNSVYVWFSDDPENSWEVTAKHSQTNITGTETINLKTERFGVYDPHLSWHQSGVVHVKGYDVAGQIKERVISDRPSTNWADLVIRRLTVPVTQLVFPTTKADATLVPLGMMPVDFPDDKTWLAIVNSSGFKCINDGAQEVAYVVIDSEIIPKGNELGIDLQVHYKKDKADLTATTTRGMTENLIFPDAFSLHKEKTSVAVCCRIFKVENKISQEGITTIAATCFNRETIDLFQLKRTEKTSANTETPGATSD